LRPLLICTLALLGATACTTPAPLSRHGAADTLWLLAADPRADAIRAADSEADLRRRFGPANVTADSIHVGEGSMEAGTVLFADDPLRRLEILWEDTAARSRPERVVVGGNPSRWAVAPGVTIGTTLKELESLNGGAFEMAGFDWDYSGTVYGWSGGRLDTLWGARTGGARLVIVRLMPDSGVADVHLGGDKANPSSLPELQRINPRVYDLIVFPR
jgi:hypothetical protein